MLVERGTPGVEYQVIDKIGHRTCQNVTMTFHDVRVPAENLLAQGDGDLVINRNFTWSGPIAGIAAVGVARGAYEFALKWAKTFTGGGVAPIINHQAVGYLLAEIAAKIEAVPVHVLEGRALHGHPRQRRPRAQRDEQVVLHRRSCSGWSSTACASSASTRWTGGSGSRSRYRESIVFPLYDAGNLAMQRRRAWGVMADPGFTPDLFVDSEPFGFTKSMEGFGRRHRDAMTKPDCSLMGFDHRRPVGSVISRLRGTADGQWCPREILLVAQQLDLVVRRAGAVVVVQMYRDHIERLAEPLLSPAEPRGGARQRGRQVVITELHRPVGDLLHLVGGALGPRQVRRQAELVQVQFHPLVRHDIKTVRTKPPGQPARGSPDGEPPASCGEPATARMLEHCSTASRSS